MFNDRTQAGKQLAEKLAQHMSFQPGAEAGLDLLVVGLPRGGVPVALEVASKFGCPLEVIMAKKLPFPGQPEYAIGAVSSDGVVVLSPDLPQNKQWNAYIEQQRQGLLERTLTTERQYYELAGYKPSSFKDKTVIVVDDGIATGMTAIAALETARRRGAKRTIMAAPVMSSDSYRMLHAHCDDVVAISVPEEFASVGQHYANFDQTTNEEVVSALRKSAMFVPCAHSPVKEPGLKAINN